MEIIQICPKCGLPAVEVNVIAVKFNIIELQHGLINIKNRWSICVNPACDCSYFSKTREFSTADLNVSLFLRINPIMCPSVTVQT